MERKLRGSTLFSAVEVNASWMNSRRIGVAFSATTEQGKLYQYKGPTLCPQTRTRKYRRIFQAETGILPPKTY